MKDGRSGAQKKQSTAHNNGKDEAPLYLRNQKTGETDVELEISDFSAESGGNFGDKFEVSSELEVPLNLE